MDSLKRSVAVLLILSSMFLLAACDKPGNPRNAQAPEPALPPPPVYIKPEQEVSVNLRYVGEVEGSDRLGFDFRVLWGDLKYARSTHEMASHKPSPATLDLGSVDARITPRLSGAGGQYLVKLLDKQGQLMAEFEIAETGKQVRLADSHTPGYRHRFVFFDRERYITAYRVQEKQGSRLGSEIGVLFVGQGWRAVDSSKKQVLEGKYNFPKVDMVLLPAAWMESRDINLTFRTLKRGVESTAGVCYS